MSNHGGHVGDDDAPHEWIKRGQYVHLGIEARDINVVVLQEPQILVRHGGVGKDVCSTAVSGEKILKGQV